jgi:hypothetical protein
MDRQRPVNNDDDDDDDVATVERRRLASRNLTVALRGRIMMIAVATNLNGLFFSLSHNLFLVEFSLSLFVPLPNAMWVSKRHIKKWDDPI